MKYGKLIDGKISYCPNPITINGKDIFTTDPTQYGYKTIVIPEPPSKDGYYAESDGWEETETEIYRRWRLEPLPDPEIEYQR